MKAERDVKKADPKIRSKIIEKDLLKASTRGNVSCVFCSSEWEKWIILFRPTLQMAWFTLFIQLLKEKPSKPRERTQPRGMYL